MTPERTRNRSGTLFLMLLGLAGCEASVPGAGAVRDHEKKRPTESTAPIGVACQASEQAFVRRAMLAVLGRRPWGQAEVDAVLAAIVGVRAQQGGDDPVPARRVVVRALMQEPAFRERWADFFMDALRVARSGTQSQAAATGTPAPTRSTQVSSRVSCAITTPPLPIRPAPVLR
jgi:hypothetical protein